MGIFVVVSIVKPSMRKRGHIDVMNRMISRTAKYKRHYNVDNIDWYGRSMGCLRFETKYNKKTFVKDANIAENVSGWRLLK
jgi:hypothetical protein